MKKQLLLSFLLAAGYTVTAQTTAIPDPLFEQELINLSIDTDGIVNGQIATADAEAVTSLTINPENTGSDYITDLTGIEAFVNLENLTVNYTMIEELNVSTMPNLKYLDCIDNTLEYLDVSNNPLLEELYLHTGGDVYPLNNINEIDLSHNPNIRKLAASAIRYINLKNGNNNPDMIIDIGVPDLPTELGNTCIEVDDATVAQNDQAPYSEWTIQYAIGHQTYSYAETCTAGTEEFKNTSVIMYPNPVSDILYVNNNTIVNKVTFYDLSGRVVKEYMSIPSSGIDVQGFQKGMYLVKIESGKQVQTQKVFIK